MEVQQLETIKALRLADVDVVQFNPWAETIDADLVHVFGSAYPHTDIIRRFVNAKIPVVAVSMFMPEKPLWYFSAFSTVSRILPTTSFSLRQESMRLADRIISLTENEKRLVSKAFNINQSKIHVVPNGIEKRFFNAHPKAFIDRYGLKDFVLCVASIEPRKNQLTIANALKNRSFDVVFIGSRPAHGGEIVSQYVSDFQIVVSSSKNLHWIDGINHNDPMLESAYSAAHTHILASTAEGLPLSPMEAAAAGNHIVLSDLPQLHEVFESSAHYINPDDTDDIRRTIEYLMSIPKPANGDQRPSWLMSWDDVAKRLIDVYISLGIKY